MHRVVIAVSLPMISISGSCSEAVSRMQTGTEHPLGRQVEACAT